MMIRERRLCMDLLPVSRDPAASSLFSYYYSRLALASGGTRRRKSVPSPLAPCPMPNAPVIACSRNSKAQGPSHPLTLGRCSLGPPNEPTEGGRVRGACSSRSLKLFLRGSPPPLPLAPLALFLGGEGRGGVRVRVRGPQTGVCYELLTT